MSFKYAFEGIFYLIKTQQNAKIHFFAALFAIGLGWWLKISNIECVIIALSIGLVFAFESINTAIEVLCDLYHPDFHPKIKIIKDLSASAVLIVTGAAIICGLFIFLPKLVQLQMF